MSLTTGRAPLGHKRAGWFTPPIPEGTTYVEPHPRRIQGIVGGRTVIDTESALMVHRPDKTLIYAFRPEDVGDLPAEPVPEADGYVEVPWTAVDTWFEEGRKLVHYPPNPYHRVDCRPTTRRLRVEVAGTVLVDTDDTVILFETALDPRLYVEKAAVRMDLLRPSETTSYCNYKGEAAYWSAHIGDVVVEDVAWSYEETLPESAPIRGYLCFYDDRADVLAEVPGRA